MSSSTKSTERGEISQKALSLYNKLQSASNCHSLLKKYLTEDIFLEVKDRTTPFGASLVDIIQSGVENLDSSVGIYAADAESYKVFALLFEPIILFYHGLQVDFAQPRNDFGDPSALSNLDPQGKHIVSTRIRCARSFKNFPFASILSEKQYGEMENTIVKVLSDLPGDLAGKYYPLSDQSKPKNGTSPDNRFFFNNGDRFLKSANAYRHWPRGRGVFCNTARTIFVWVNEEDHLRIISMSDGADLPTIYSRFIRIVEEIGSKIEFARDEKFGHLTFCPTNIGTTMRASVHIKLPNLANNPDLLTKLADKFRLQIRGTKGEHTEVENAVFDISNKMRCGLSEFSIMKVLQTGILEIIRVEESLD